MAMEPYWNNVKESTLAQGDYLPDCHVLGCEASILVNHVDAEILEYLHTKFSSRRRALMPDRQRMAEQRREQFKMAAEEARRNREPPLPIDRLALQEALGSIEDGDIVRDFVEGMNRDEIAAERGLTPQEVNSRLQTALAGLETFLGARPSARTSEPADDSYRSIPLKPARVVRTNYNLAGRIRPLPYELED